MADETQGDQELPEQDQSQADQKPSQELDPQALKNALAATRKEAANYRTELRRLQEEKAQRDEAELTEAQKREKRIKDLEDQTSQLTSISEQRDAYAAALQAVIKARIEAVPGDKRAAVRKLAPDTLPLDQQLAQVEAAIELVGSTQPAPRGAGGNPPRAGSSDERAARIEETKREAARTGAYSRM